MTDVFEQQQFAAQHLAAITANPDLWAKTVVVLTHAGSGGYFDHVPPPTPPIENLDEYVGLQPIGFGPRVPALVVSPWTRGGQREPRRPGPHLDPPAPRAPLRRRRPAHQPVAARDRGRPARRARLRQLRPQRPDRRRPAPRPGQPRAGCIQRLHQRCPSPPRPSSRSPSSKADPAPSLATHRPNFVGGSQALVGDPRHHDEVAACGSWVERVSRRGSSSRAWPPSAGGRG